MKLILSERELEIIKTKEYKRGWQDCDMAHAEKEDSWQKEFNNINAQQQCSHQWVSISIGAQCSKCGLLYRNCNLPMEWL